MGMQLDLSDVSQLGSHFQEIEAPIVWKQTGYPKLGCRLGPMSCAQHRILPNVKWSRYARCCCCCCCVLDSCSGRRLPAEPAASSSNNSGSCNRSSRTCK